MFKKCLQWQIPERYKKEKLAEGAFGVVFKCFEPTGNRVFTSKETIFGHSEVSFSPQISV
jgi:hypothetical protein